MSRKLLSVPELAAHYSVSRMTIYRWRDGGMPYYEFPKGGAIRFDLPDVERWMKRVTTPRRVRKAVERTT